MLVHYGYQRGSTIIDGKRIYGFLEKYNPVHISWYAYKTNRKSLIEAPYTKSILEGMFPGRTFPDIIFTYSQIRYLNWDQLCSLCKAFGITTNRKNRLRRTAIQKFFKEHC